MITLFRWRRSLTSSWRLRWVLFSIFVSAQLSIFICLFNLTTLLLQLTRELIILQSHFWCSGRDVWKNSGLLVSKPSGESQTSLGQRDRLDRSEYLYHVIYISDISTKLSNFNALDNLIRRISLRSLSLDIKSIESVKRMCWDVNILILKKKNILVLKLFLFLRTVGKKIWRI